MSHVIIETKVSKEKRVNASFGVAASALVVALQLWPGIGLAQTGSISGTVRVEGTPPVPRLMEVTKNQVVCGDTIRARDVVVKHGRLAFAVASIEGLAGESEPSEYLLSNSGCSFEPPVLATAAGDTLVVDNQDDVLHNTHLNLLRGTRTRTVGTWALSRKGTTIRATRPLRRAGIIDVECDAHPWMHGKIVIFDHPYFAVTNEAGVFEVTGVPVGTHTLKVWHEVFGDLEQTVTVRADQATSVTFVFPASAATRSAPKGQ